MRSSLNDLQDRALGAASAWAHQHPCLERVFIFGSAVRGDDHAGSDLDIAVEYVPEIYEPTKASDDMMRSHSKLNDTAEAWALRLGASIGRPVHLHRMYSPGPEDRAWPAIVKASANPVAVRGKTWMVATPAIARV
jgi:predicted nucleotidyltransferase